MRRGRGTRERFVGMGPSCGEGDRGPAYERTLVLKLVLVAASGLTAWLHARATTRPAMATFGALTGLTALLTLFVGVQLAG